MQRLRRVVCNVLRADCSQQLYIPIDHIQQARRTESHRAGHFDCAGIGRDIEFEVSNFENLIACLIKHGQYTFTVNTAGIQDLAGNGGTGSTAVSWNLATAPLPAPTNLAISPDTGYSSTDGITNVANVAFRRNAVGTSVDGLRLD